jgi:acetylornithine deacetylase/succinyl-diaminopimelate desuccinylase-like protein
VEALLRTAGRLPLNLKFLIEGEEEVGSTHLKAFVTEERERLAADVVVISDSSLYAPNLPAIVYGLRGLCALELTVRGPARDLHSGEYGGAVQNPLHALAELLAGLHDRQGRIAVEGFYDDVCPLSAAERAAAARLPFDEEAYRRDLGVPETFGETGYTALERSTARPTVEVNGMWGGFLGEGSKTVIPSVAHAKLTCRLVPKQDPGRILDLVAHHLERHRPPGVRLEVALRGGSPATLAPLDSEWVRAAARALRAAFGADPVYTRMGGSIGVVPAFTQHLKAPVVLMGFGLADDHIHSPDESFDLGNYDRGQRALAAYWLDLGVARGT